MRPGSSSSRDSVDHVAGRLDVTRYTIYNYLGEIRGRPALRRLRAQPRY